MQSLFDFYDCFFIFKNFARLYFLVLKFNNQIVVICYENQWIILKN